ncbi:MAG: alanine--glyoxylate aminotransferase family protein [Deinococcales bacterium]
MSHYRTRLVSPGPVDVPPQVLEASAKPMIHHRSAEFKQIFLATREKLAKLAWVPGEDVLILAASGTAAFEAGLISSVPKGAKVIGINAGKFGERWVKVAKSYGYEVVEMKLSWGEVADPAEVAKLIAQHPDAKALMTTHSETSTGALHDVAEIAKAARKQNPDLLILVDCVTSLGVSEVKPKDWDIDGMFSGSQKGLMCPPGLAFAWLSERAWASAADNKGTLNSSFYLDLVKERKAQQKGETAYTAAVSLVRALDAALDLILAEGIVALWRRKKQMNDAILAAGTALDCEIFAKRPSPAVAALKVPSHISAPAVVKAFAKRGMEIAGGQDESKPYLIRPSVMGYFDRYDVLAVVAALEEVLAELGQQVTQGLALGKAFNFLQT